MTRVPSPPAADAYRGEAGRAYHGDKRGLPPAALPWVAATRAALFQPHVRATDAVFEFGCGAGWNLAALRAARRVGGDVADFLRPEVEAAGAEFVTDTAALPDAAFDVVIAHHALEHVEEPRAALRELHRLLRAGGTLLAAVPYEKERRYRRHDPAEPNRHLYAWNPQTFGALLAVAGFAVRDIGLRRYGYDRRAAALAARLKLRATGFRTLRGLLRTLRPLHEVAAVAGRK
jgi:SAM-dependent methyltransferase